MKNSYKEGFSLLEIIVVVIIVGILASLAFPRLWLNIELSRVAEAKSVMGTIRREIENCALEYGGKYTVKSPDGNTILYNCISNDMNLLDMPNPSELPGSHFDYSITAFSNSCFYSINATRNSLDGGNQTDILYLVVDADNIWFEGTGAYESINTRDDGASMTSVCN